jgi:hypothetical protein
MISNQRFVLAAKAELYDVFGGAMVKLPIICPPLFLPRKGQNGMFPVQRPDSALCMIQNVLPHNLQDTKSFAGEINKRPMGMIALTTTIDLAGYLL